MAFLCRLKQEKHKLFLFSNELKRYYNSNHVFSVANQHTCSRSLNPVSNCPTLGPESSRIFFSNVRFYAAPVQFQQKKEEKDTTSEHRLNEQITAQFVRLVTDEGHSVMSRYDALKRAKSLQLDLVEVDGRAKPPACKIYDYKKEKYLQKVREKEHKKKLKSKGLKSGAFKEIRFAGKISKNDLQIKADTVKRLIESGHRVKCTAIEPTEAMGLEALLSRFSALIEDVAIKEGEPQVEKKQAFFVVRHVKFGGPRSGGKKTSSSASSANEPLTEVVLDDTNSSEQTQNSEWAAFDENDDLNEVFNLDAEVSETTKNKHLLSEQSNPAASSVPKPVMENRYAKVQKDSNGRNTWNRADAVPHIQNQVKQPQFNMNPSPQFPNQRSQPHFNANDSSQVRQTPRVEVPAYEIQRQDSSHSGNSNSPTKSFGIFNPRRENTQTNEQTGPAESNRYKKVDPSGSARSPSVTVPGPGPGPGPGTGTR